MWSVTSHSITNFNLSTGLIGPGAFLIGTGFMSCTQQMGAVVMLTVAVGLCGFHFSGYFINHGDIAPPFAGTMFGITNTLATVPGILAPFVVAALTPNVGLLSGAKFRRLYVSECRRLLSGAKPSRSYISKHRSAFWG